MNELFETLNNISSRNLKLDVLRQNTNNDLFKEVIRLALDPFTQFYIRKIPSYTQTSITRNLETAINDLGALSSRSITGNSAIDYLRDILSSLSVDDAKVIERIIKKDLRCGVSTSTANAIWNDLIPEYPCMLCSQYDEKLVSKIKFPAFVNVKMDGMRFNAIVRDGEVEFRSRNGKAIELLGNLKNDFLQMSDGKNLVFDGELLVRTKDGLMSRQEGNGILNRANKGTITKEQASLVVAVIWDMIPYYSFITGVYRVGYEVRFANLCERYKKALPRIDDKVSLVEYFVVNDIEEAQKIFRTLLSKGEEGIILKDYRSIWENKRSKGQIKFKAVLDADLKCIEVQPGTGKYQGLIGSLLCETSDGKLKVSVGSGFTDEDRKVSADTYLNKIITVNYNSVIVNKQGETSLFLPIYVETRTDKDIANSIDELK